MAGRKNASKTSKKVQVDFTFATQDKINEAKRLEKKKSKKARKKLRKLSFGVIMLSLVLLIGSAVGSFFGMKYLVRNDVFELNGKDEITLQIGKDTYTDEGAKVIAFGKNDESKVKVETNLTKNEDGTYSATEEGTYYMIYTKPCELIVNKSAVYRFA